jgi:hypothetical protein
MEEGDKYTDKDHILEFFVESFFNNLGIIIAALI